MTTADKENCISICDTKCYLLSGTLTPIPSQQSGKLKTLETEQTGTMQCHTVDWHKWWRAWWLKGKMVDWQFGWWVPWSLLHLKTVFCSLGVIWGMFLIKKVIVRNMIRRRPSPGSNQGVVVCETTLKLSLFRLLTVGINNLTANSEIDWLVKILAAELKIQATIKSCKL